MLRRLRQVPERLGRLRQVPERLGLPWQDVVLALVFALAAVAWAVYNAVHQSDSPFIQPVKVARHAGPPDAPEAPDPGGVDITVTENDSAPHPAILLNLLTTLPLAIRRRLPYLSFVISLGSALVLRDGITWPGFLAILVTAYSATAYGRWMWGSFALLGVGGLMAAAKFSNAIPPIPGRVGPFIVLAPAALTAVAIRTSRGRADAATARAAALEHEKAATARAAIAEERARIARELHDVVSHHVSVMVVQAGAAGKVIDTRPDLAAGAIAAIEASGREAMAELRQLLGLVTPTEDRLRPQPGLADLDALVDSVRGAGQPVTLQREAQAYPPGVELTAYRVVQEGLTNALRYAPGAATTVRLRTDGGDLTVEVANEAGRAPVTGRGGTGSGLVGLAERVRLHHGSLESGPRLGGGYRLLARIPVHPVEPTGQVPALQGEG
jgi:signal transduction histidine kinase